MKNLFDKSNDKKLANYVNGIIDETINGFEKENFEVKLKFNNLLMEYFKRYNKNIRTDYSELVPVSFELLSYEARINILNDCLEKNIYISQSEIYILSLEGSYNFKNYDGVSK